mmetsp:Transcript_102197/g.294189  ORF Transcript_102197/g.294189 Transcript_102197/m.294189 type:complete len:231 (+) Transcript_102197:457-1149(+)
MRSLGILLGRVGVEVECSPADGDAHGGLNQKEGVDLRNGWLQHNTESKQHDGRDDHRSRGVHRRAGTHHANRAQRQRAHNHEGAQKQDFSLGGDFRSSLLLLLWSPRRLPEVIHHRRHEDGGQWHDGNPQRRLHPEVLDQGPGNRGGNQPDHQLPALHKRLQSRPVLRLLLDPLRILGLGQQLTSGELDRYDEEACRENGQVQVLNWDDNHQRSRQSPANGSQGDVWPLV